jgi:hypothetical protein
MYVGPDQFLQAIYARRGFLQENRDALQLQLIEYSNEVDRLSKLSQRNDQEMASYLLAEVEDHDLKKLEKKLRYPQLLKIKRQFEAQLQQDQQQKAQMETQHEVVHIDFHLSQVKDELATISDAYQSLKKETDAWFQSPWFVQLHTRGFFNPTYKPGFLDRFHDWRAMSFLMEDLERQHRVDFPTADKVRDTWIKRKDEFEPINELWGDLQQRLRALEHLAQTYKDLCDAPQRLFQQMLDALTAAINQHLDSCPEDLRVELASQDKYLITFLNKKSGLHHQIQYLREIPQVRIQPQLQALDRDLTKLDAKARKVLYKRRYVSVTDYEKMRSFDPSKWDKRHASLRDTRTRISSFHKYQKGSFVSDYLWWDVMTGGARGDDLYLVRTFHQRHPHWDHQRWQDPWERDGFTTSSSAFDDAADALTQSARDAEQWDSDIS